MPKVQSRKSKTLGTRYFVRFRLNGAQTTLTFGTRPEAERFADDCERRGPQWAWDTYQADEQAAAEMTLSDWAERHFDSMPHVSPATLEGYKRDWRRRWEPHLGHMKLSRITREDVTRALAAQTGADKTIENAWGTLATMLKTAVLDRHIDRSPATGVKLGRRTTHEKAEHRYLTPPEILQVVEDTPERYKPLVWTLAGTGMRWGEATALLVGDVDLEARTIRVTKAWKRDREKGWYVGPPKTEKAKRTITLPGEVVVALEPIVRGRGRRELLFTNRDGNPVKHQPFYREHWTKACTRNLAEPRPRIHDLRHSHVAILIAGGAGLPVIQHRLGHEKITTTIDTYGHLMPDLHVAAAEITSRAFSSVAAPLAIEG
jgi:integrase